MFKGFFDRVSRSTVVKHWARVYRSHMKNMARGAQEISKLIPHAHGDNWRRCKNHHKAK